MTPKVDYVFTRDYLDNNRINLTHCLWTKVFGYVIHPKVPSKQPDLRVADVGMIPSNISFKHWDVKQELPEELTVAFDIVRVRFLSFVLLNGEVQGLVEKLFRMLKPGGYLQWGEPDMETLRMEQAGTGLETESLKQLF
ncbi:hypothetical protein VMCG_06593 [Cytospora schulzeri]|uniref:Methyltransferase type 11 domain-containing protein n=1 Tax=Cytospora schulzeri TaxID=448051 RepID=A0A423W6Y1_9PEZI|nr:hypothetical protein VMCG_06593 [Valsa malicola]